MTRTLSHQKNLWWFTTTCWYLFEGMSSSEVETKKSWEPDLRRVLSLFNSADFFCGFFSEKDVRDVRANKRLSNFFRVAYVDRDARPKKKKICPKTRLFWCFLGHLEGQTAGLASTPSHTTNCGWFWAMLRWWFGLCYNLIHPPKYHPFWAISRCICGSS